MVHHLDPPPLQALGDQTFCDSKVYALSEFASTSGYTTVEDAYAFRGKGTVTTSYRPWGVSSFSEHPKRFLWLWAPRGGTFIFCQSPASVPISHIWPSGVTSGTHFPPFRQSSHIFSRLQYTRSSSNPPTKVAQPHSWRSWWHSVSVSSRGCFAPK